MKSKCEQLILVAGWRTTNELKGRDLLLLTCLVHINISVTSSFSFFYLQYFDVYVSFGFDETKPVLKYNFKERDLILYILGHIDNDIDMLQRPEALTQFQRGLVWFSN